MVVLALIPLGSSVGDIFLSHGMRQTGPISFREFGALFLCLRNGWVLGGIFLLIVFMISNILAFSWMDLTFVLPATSIGYLVTPLLAHFWLREHVSVSRWLGIGLIVCGVGVGVQGPYRTGITEPLGET